ncbi:MAG: phosphatase [Dictyoglomus sp. NZ13-RE01]|nr:MAG: phosphatase [Dictyoglomus sp. NZ13-RE01]
MRYKLIITDFDGSLVGDSLNISYQNISAINRFREMGGDITIATGRRWSSIKPFVELLNIKIPVILYNGAGIYDPTKENWIYRKFLRVEFLKEILRFLKTYEGKCSFGFYINDELYEEWKIDKIFSLLEGKVIKFFIEADRKILEEIQRGLNKYFYDKVTIVISSYKFLEILPKGCSKGRAMLKLLHLLKISPMEVIAIGDYDNDLDMLKLAGIGITLPNASERVKKFADFVTKSDPDGAIAEIINKLERGELI